MLSALGNIQFFAIIFSTLDVFHWEWNFYKLLEMDALIGFYHAKLVMFHGNVKSG